MTGRYFGYKGNKRYMTGRYFGYKGNIGNKRYIT
jgi:hypothetical protein